MSGDARAREDTATGTTADAAGAKEHKRPEDTQSEGETVEHKDAGGRKEKAYITHVSRVVTHLSTQRAWPGLTSVSGTGTGAFPAV